MAIQDWDPQVGAAVVTSCVALIVAVVGVIATGVAQSRSTKKAHANALDLFKQQTAEQAQARKEAAEEQRQLRAEEVEERRRTAFLR